MPKANSVTLCLILALAIFLIKKDYIFILYNHSLTHKSKKKAVGEGDVPERLRVPKHH